MDENETIISKKLLVKSNKLIEARYRLTEQEQRVIYWLVAQIKPNDEDFKPYNLNIKEFSEIVGLRPDSQYFHLKKITKHLINRSLEILDPNKETLLQTAWLSSAFYELRQGYVSLEFSPKLKPYLLQLKENFTSFIIPPC